MKRRDGTANTGYIDWPTHLTNSGEGGSFVYLVVIEHEFDNDEFVQCISQGAYLFDCDLVDPDTTAHEWDPAVQGQKFTLERKLFPNSFDSALPSTDTNKWLSVPFLAAVCLGTSGGSWYVASETERFVRTWHCEYNDLTEKGKLLFDSLKDLYNRDPMLLTFIDT